MPRFNAKRVLIAGAAVASLAVATHALATYVAYMSWDANGDGGLGNFDLDLQMNNGLSGPFASFNATYGTHSPTDIDGSGFFVVHSRLGFVMTLNSPRLVRDVGALNAATPLSVSDSPYGMEMRWVHETPTVAYNPETKKWIGIWHTFVKSHPFTGPEDEHWYIAPTGDCGDHAISTPVGKNFGEYGWIAVRGWSNTADAQPNPNIASLAAKERRVFIGAGYDPGLESTTNSWAENSPSSQPDDPFPNSGYAAYSEPGAFMDSDETLYLAMTGNWCDGDDVYGDVVLVKSTDDGANWTAVGVVLNAQDATDIDSDWAYFTASSMYRYPGDGSVRLIVTGARKQGISSAGGYEGIVEFKFSSLASGTLVTSGGAPAVQAFEPKESGAFTGAGTFSYSTGKHIISRLCVTGAPCPAIFTELELNW